MRRLAVSLALLLLAGCGGAAASETTTTTPQATDTVPSTAAAGDTAPSTTNAPETTTTAVAETVPDGPIAPGFQLELADGSSFALADATKPIYMVFWAEW